MHIACLAWGSLIWKPEPLTLASAWRPDGPPLPLEFARVGDLGELATVLCADTPVQPTWWALLDVADLATARERLREREQIDPRRPEWVGSLVAAAAPSEPHGPHAAPIAQWLRQHALDAVVWTALPPRSAGLEGRKPSADEAVAYLGGLRGHTRAHAEDYVRRVPTDIRTPYRRAIEQRLGWLPREAADQ